MYIQCFTFQADTHSSGSIAAADAATFLKKSGLGDAILSKVRGSVIVLCVKSVTVWKHSYISSCYMVKVLPHVAKISTESLV